MKHSPNTVFNSKLYNLEQKAWGLAFLIGIP
jgi:hypothetical protein